jgi:hypothetical protein
MKTDHQTYDYFTGKISPFLLFEMEFHSLFYVVENHKNDRFYPELNPASQVATIGLLAYFEAFCKHQFAAIVNLFPNLISQFAAKRGEPKIEFSSVVTFKSEIEKNIGFILAEQYDFGTAKSINGLFRDLLSITPFSKKESETFSEILFKRNLLVHHAGYYTLQYLKDKTITEEAKVKVFKEAVKITTEDYGEVSDFLFEMAMKITRETVKALKSNPEFQSLSLENERAKAIEEMLQGVWDTLE